jgi:NAD(P)-dependent dehydrogenase (short-subunit alcohol dehydrogenase family)
MTEYAQYPSLKGRGVIVTGGASGIGEAIARAFHAQGARVAVLDKDEQAGVRLAQDCAGLVFKTCDVTDIAALQKAIADSIAELGGLRVLVNNAANDARHSFEDLTSDGWDRAIAVNLKHYLFAAQAARPALATSGGSIICLGSIAWLNNTTGMIAYTTAKAGVHGLVRTLARQLGPENIRVNALLPGWTMTQRQRALWVDAAAEREIEAAQCLPGRVMPDDVARMALFLGADDSAMCTQQSFIVDGGWV